MHCRHEQVIGRHHRRTGSKHDNPARVVGLNVDDARFCQAFLALGVELVLWENDDLCHGRLPSFFGVSSFSLATSAAASRSSLKCITTPWFGWNLKKPSLSRRSTPQT